MEDDADLRRFSILREISHFARHGVVEGVEFDLRHKELDPRHWGMFLIGDKYLRSDGQPFIWFPWYGVFDKEAVRRSIVSEEDGPPSEAAVRRMLKYLTPEVFAYSGDKITIDHVRVVHTGDPFSHQHDFELRLAFLKIIRKNGRMAQVKTPIRLLGHTSLLLRGNSRNIIEKLTARIFAHHKIESLTDPLVDSILEKEELFESASLTLLFHLHFRNRETFARADKLDLHDPQNRTAYETRLSIEQAMRLGYYWANAEAELGMKHFALAGLGTLHGAKKAGIQSGKSRQLKAQRTWKAHALELILQQRQQNPGLSQHRLADEIIFSWKLATPAPGHTTLTSYISSLEKEGIIPRRAKE